MAQLRDEELLNQVIFKLRSLRNDRGLSQEKVLNDTGVHIGRIESEKVNISISTLKILCDYYGISLSDFFSDTDQMR